MRKPLRLVLLAAALVGLPIPPANASASDRGDGYRNVPGIGLARELPSGNLELFKDHGTGLVVHGHDTTSMIPAASTAGPSTASFAPAEPTCVTSGNYYAHVIYAYPVNRTSRYASMAEHIRDLVRDNTGRMVEEAGEFGASRKYRVLCNGSNQITVSNVGVGVTSVTDFNALTLDLQNRGYNSGGVKYWVWFDGTAGPGLLGTGHVYDDSSPGVGNSNNGNGQAMFAVLWGDEAGVPQYEATTWMHENGHNMGAVVSDAPNTSGNLHCTDDKDIMCYVDGGAQAACCFRPNVCTDREHFDCRHDDYFHPSPTSGFLTNHWNLGSTVNRFMDATAAITLRFAVSSLTVNEDAGSVTLTVDRIGSTAGTVGVTASTSPGTAQAGNDFTATTQTLSFGPGITQRTISVPIISDGATGESSESFSVGLSAATGGATIGSPSTVTVTISESSGPPVIQFETSTLTVNEGSATAALTVVRSGATGTAVDVSYETTAVTATSGSDYEDVSGVVSFAAGQTSRTISVPLLDDQRYESNETFHATLSTPTGGATLGSRTLHTTTIAETDLPPTLALTASAAQVNEAAGSYSATVTRTGATDDPVGVTLTTTAGTAGSSDFTAVTTSLSFGAGVVSQQVPITIAGDASIEGTETFTVSLQTPTGVAQLGSPASTLVSILDDDGGSVEMQSPSLTASESAAVTFTATRTLPAAPASVSWTLFPVQPSGPSTTGSFSFAAGVSSASVTMHLNDAISTGDRVFSFVLSNPVSMSLGARTTTSLTLTDDETPPSVGFVDAAITVEEHAGTRQVTITRSGNINAAATVSLGTTNGTASTTTDLSVPTGTITFAAGQASRTVSLTIADDVLPERDESATLTLSGPVGATLGRAAVPVTILASDQQPDVIVQGTVPTASGNNQYSTQPGTQSATAASPRVGGPNAGTFFIENDGNATNRIALFATTPNSATELRYLIGGVDVTTAMTSAVGYTVTMEALTRLPVRVEHLPIVTAVPGAQRGVVMRAVWTGDGTREDVATLTFATI